MKEINQLHHRVSDAGRRLGRAMARMAVLGRKRLESEGLTDLALPGMRDELCASCAAREGTVPNGCVQTQLDFMKAVIEGVRFCCHAPNDGRMCAGFVSARAEQVARPMPKEVSDMLAKWEYSPPDDDGQTADVAP